MPQRASAPLALSVRQLAMLVAWHVLAFRFAALSHVPRPTLQSSEASPQWWPGAGAKETLLSVPLISGMHAVEFRSAQSMVQEALAESGSGQVRPETPSPMRQDGEGSTSAAAAAAASSASQVSACAAAQGMAMGIAPNPKEVQCHYLYWECQGVAQ